MSAETSKHTQTTCMAGIPSADNKTPRSNNLKTSSESGTGQQSANITAAGALINQASQSASTGTLVQPKIRQLTGMPLVFPPDRKRLRCNDDPKTSSQPDTGQQSVGTSSRSLTKELTQFSRCSSWSEVLDVSPLERLVKRRAEQTAAEVTITTAKDLENFIKTNDVNQPSVRARLKVEGKVVWTSTHTVKTSKVTRIHIADKEALASLDAMHKTFRDDYDRNFMEVDQMLITATIFGCKSDSPGIPPDGATVIITNPSTVRLLWVRRAN